MKALALVLLSPVLVMLAASRLVDFAAKWPPRIAVLFAAAAPGVLTIALVWNAADAVTQAAAFPFAVSLCPYGLIVGGFTYALVRPR